MSNIKTNKAKQHPSKQQQSNNNSKTPLEQTSKQKNKNRKERKKERKKNGREKEGKKIKKERKKERSHQPTNHQPPITTPTTTPCSKETPELPRTGYLRMDRVQGRVVVTEADIMAREVNSLPACLLPTVLSITDQGY